MFGALGETRTLRTWFLRPVRIPIPSPGQKINNLMSEFKSAEPNLWRYAATQPYKDTKSFSCEKDFTLSFPKRQAVPFERTEIKQLGAPRKNRTFI